jgi:hypothetical protein
VGMNDFNCGSFSTKCGETPHFVENNPQSCFLAVYFILDIELFHIIAKTNRDGMLEYIVCGE